MQFLAARSLWTNLLAFRYDMPSAISPVIWIIFLSGGRTWLLAFWGWGEMKKTVYSQPQHRILVTAVWGMDATWGNVHVCVGEKMGIGCVYVFTPSPFYVSALRVETCVWMCEEKIRTSLRKERRWLLRSPRVISSIITKVGCPWETTPSSRTLTNHNTAQVSYDD